VTRKRPFITIAADRVDRRMAHWSRGLPARADRFASATPAAASPAAPTARGGRVRPDPARHGRGRATFRGQTSGQMRHDAAAHPQRIVPVSGAGDPDWSLIQIIR